MTKPSGDSRRADGESLMALARSRRNLVARETERWKPPLHSRTNTKQGRIGTAIRDLVNLQLGSISRDVAAFMRTVHGKLLDVGCGDQPFRHLVPAGVEYTGIDRAETLENFEYRNPETRYFKGDRWPVEDQSYDAILCTEVLEHVSDPLAFLAEAHRGLVPGGRIFLTVPFAARWHYIPFDYWRFTPSCLDRLLSTCGFEDIQVYCRGDETTVACYKVMALVLPLLFPQQTRGLLSIAKRAAGILFLPAFVALAAMANLSLYFAIEADDCLGFTVMAMKARGSSLAPAGTGTPLGLGSSIP